MEFTRHAIKPPALLSKLVEYDIKELDFSSEVQPFQNTIVDEHAKDRRLKWEKSHPFKNFFVSKYYASTMVILGILTFSMLFVSKPLTIVCFLLTVLSIVFFHLALDEKYLPPTQWQESPFQKFEKEYPGKIANLICPCNATHCEKPIFNLWVEHHPFSKIKFLMVEDPDDEDGNLYYIDWWEKKD